MERLLFIKITSFLLSIFIVLLLQYSTLPKTASVYTAESFSSEIVFCFFPQIAIYQCHLINPLITSFAWSVRESIAIGEHVCRSCMYAVGFRI
jgi:hypothetical protein